MKNKLTDLTDHLFIQLERLQDESLVDGALRDEIARAGAITTVAREIISAGRLVVDARKVIAGSEAVQPPIKLLGLDQ